MTPEEINSRLLHRDGMMLVLDKPAGLPVHRGPKGGENLEESFVHLRFGLPRSPALAHRLDRDTSGCLVLGRHRKALEKLGNLFKQGRIAKTYWAIVEGGPEEERGEIDLPLARLDANRGWWMKVDPLGQPSRSLWTVLGRGEHLGKPVSLLALEPLTGRTHQLRVHSAAKGWPILGDPVYGSAPRSPDPELQLHARRIEIPFSKNPGPVVVHAPVPERMRALALACGWDGVEPAPAQSPTSGEKPDAVMP